MQNYLLTVLVKNDLDEKARGALLDSIKEQFETQVKEDLWGSRSLSYPIKHQDKAYYAHFEFKAEENKISSLDKMIKLNEDIIRYLLLRKEDKKVRKAARVKNQELNVVENHGGVSEEVGEKGEGKE